MSLLRYCSLSEGEAFRRPALRLERTESKEGDVGWLDMMDGAWKRI